jgi:peptidoglycan/xylan/chitin deacetylase (PgdA/CDA1 family)
VGCPHDGLSRRAFVGLLGLGVAGTVVGCGGGATEQAGKCAPNPFAAAGGDGGGVKPVAVGVPQVLSRGPRGNRRIALTVDDGTCVDCVAGYVEFASRSGVHLTFSPNGAYAKQWDPQAPTLRPLIECGQVQMINHTFTHQDLTMASAAAIRDELERNEEWGAGCSAPRPARTSARRRSASTTPTWRPPRRPSASIRS